MGWRVKEVSDLRIAARTARSLSESTVLRASVALLYAHWEGFIKCSSESYINFVECQRLPYRDLADCFVAIGMKGHLHLVTESKKSFATQSAVKFIFDHLDDRASLSIATAINTESNLKSVVFDNIARSIGIDTAYYEPSYNLIDKELVHRRNKVAHGERMDISRDDWVDLSNNVLVLMRNFKTDLENAATLSAFRR